MQLQRPQSYDPVKRIITGDDEATKLLERQYRSPWQHPFTANVKEEERVETTKALSHEETLGKTVMPFVKLSVFVPSWQIGKL